MAAAAARWTGGDHQQEDRIFFILRRGPGLKCVNLLFLCCLLIGYKLGCQRDFDIPNDFTEASIEDIDQHLGK